MANIMGRRARMVRAVGKGWAGDFDIFTGKVAVSPLKMEAAPPGAREREPVADGSLGNYKQRKAGALGAGRGGIGKGRGMFGGALSRFR